LGAHLHATTAWIDANDLPGQHATGGDYRRVFSRPRALALSWCTAIAHPAVDIAANASRDAGDRSNMALSRLSRTFQAA
jgi:hypothetical protein